MSAYLLPTAEVQFLDGNGVPLAGGSVAFYIPGTLTPKTTWQDPNEVTANTNPVTLDAAGRAIIWGSGAYRQIVKDVLGNTIYDQLTFAPQFGVGGQAVFFDTIADFEAASVDPSTPIVNVSGYYTAGDGGAGGYIQASSGAGPGKVQSADGQWWILQKAMFYFSEQFGAKGDNSNDDLTPWNNASSFAGSNGGGIVAMLAKTYKIVAGDIAVPSGVTIQGVGRYVSTFNFANGANDCVVMAGTSGTPIYGVGLRSLQLSHTAKTGGRTLVLAFANRTKFEDVQVTNSWCGFELWALNDTLFDNVEFQGVLGGASAPAAYYGGYAPSRCYGFFWHAAGDGSNRCDQLTTRNVFINCLGTSAATAADAFVTDGWVNTWNGYDTSAEQCNHGLWVKNSAASASYVAAYFIHNNFNTENCCTRSTKIEGGRTFHFTDSTLYNTSGSSVVGSSDGYAVEVLADASASITSDIRFIACDIGSSTQTGLWCAARDVWVDDCAFLAGAGATTNTFPAIEVASPAEDVKISNSTIRTWGSPLFWSYGLLVDAGTTFISAKDNSFRGAQTRSIQWNTTDLNSTCSNNDGDNPQKPVPVAMTATNGMTLTAADMVGGALALGGTPGAYTATTPTAALLVAGIQNPCIGETIPLLLSNSANGALTLNLGAGVTAVGNAINLASGVSRNLTLEFTNCAAGTEAVTIYA